jgi:peroxiredoxin
MRNYRFLKNSGRTNHLQAFGSIETKICDFQLFENDLERQNIIGQNKGGQK